MTEVTITGMVSVCFIFFVIATALVIHWNLNKKMKTQILRMSTETEWQDFLEVSARLQHLEASAKSIKEEFELQKSNDRTRFNRIEIAIERIEVETIGRDRIAPKGADHNA